MTGFVHFLIRDPLRSGQFIHPDELSDASYQGYPAFYLVGDASQTLLDAYTFPAIHRGATVATSLERAAGTSTIYFVEIAGVGRFEFRATAIGGGTPVVGGSTAFAGLQVLRQLKPKRPLDLNRAVIESEFYFVGYSRRIERELSAG